MSGGIQAQPSGRHWRLAVGVAAGEDEVAGVWGIGAVSFLLLHVPCFLCECFFLLFRLAPGNYWKVHKLWLGEAVRMEHSWIWCCLSLEGVCAACNRVEAQGTGYELPRHEHETARDKIGPRSRDNTKSRDFLYITQPCINIGRLII